MSVVEVKVPAVGESVQEGMIYEWHKNDGDFVELDDVLVELETDKATVEVVSEASGVFKRLKNEGDTVQVGDVLATIDTAASSEASAPAKPAAKVSSEPPQQPAEPKSPMAEHLSPAANRIVNEHGINPANIDGTGRGGRVTKSDLVKHMESKPAPAPAKKETPPMPQISAGASSRTERREPMSMLRRKIAERLVTAQQTAAMLTTFNEVDMSAVMELRKNYKDKFKEEHGVNLGFMSFFCKAVVEGLKAFPAINGWIEGSEIVYHEYYDVGVAVSAPKGLVVPVVRDVDKMSFAEVEQAILHYAIKARDGKISLDDMTGGTFTVSNGGVFGSLLSTPILNPPQSAILGMHKIQERAVVENGQVVVKPMMYLAVSYDHRIVDGKEAVGFLVKIKDCIENPTRILLGV